jgi:oxygen-independent coproporphyrinogen-3 oxidase
MFDIATQHLSDAGLNQYEISNYAVPGQVPDNVSKHNMKYWLRHPYLGIGLDAHSMLTRSNQTPVRFSCTDDLPTFLANPTWQDLNPLTPQAELEEAWFLGLRLTTGLDLHQLEQTHGNLEPFMPVLDQLIQDGFLKQSGTRIALTPRGQLLSNDVFAQFLDVQHEVKEELCPAS